MRSERNYSFIGTTDPMTSSEVYHCEKYLKRNKRELVQAGKYLIDTAALLSLFHLDCWNCRRVHRETCCEGGQPYAVESRQVFILEREFPAISAHLTDRQKTKKWLDQGVWDKTPGTIRMEHGNCMFYQERDGRYGCAIHAYAEQMEQDVLPLKPFSCQLYPLDLIQTDLGILLTAVTNETSSFSRWGTDYLEQFYCASLDRRKVATHLDAHLFAVDGYRPAYEWNLPLFRYLLGDEAKRIESILQEKIEQSATTIG
ncbi:DUF3109 family protein [Brevibacillus invocatus]|uniref:DUF3109 family protein n=2 Tax=Brevibacillus TaxID=55080 RepID=A0A3M8BV42_9BACL|nr:DUF3109 family protein [Brevibacillus sp. AY1]RNB67291.1 DUF3109 family protein [Brevibacillus invocatus]